jgi:hypothetical protein
VRRSKEIEAIGNQSWFNKMLEPTEKTPEIPVEPDEISESIDISSDDLDAENEPNRGFKLPSLTLIFALLLLSGTIGISISAGFFLWSLSDHPVNPEASTSAQSDN